MRRVAFSLVLVLACTDSAPKGRVAVRTVDLGDGQTATLWDDGSFGITRDGAELIGSAGRPIFAKYTDPDSVDGWHDPTLAPASTAFAPVAAADVGFEAAGPGILHVRTQGAASLVALAASLGDEFLAGTGERFDHVDPRGQIVPMQLALDGSRESGTNDRHVPIPLLASSRGWALFVESRESGAFDVGKTTPNALVATFEGGAMDAWFIVDRDPLRTIAKYNEHVGLPRPLPREVLAPMYWRNEWKSDTETHADANELRARHIPTTSFWIDNPWQTSYNDFTLDPARFVDAAGMMSKLAASGYRVLGWSTPYLDNPQGQSPTNEAQKRFVTADAQGLLVKDGDGKPYAAPGFDTKKRFGMLDFSTDAGRAFWATWAGTAVQQGFSAFKLDYGEDLLPSIFSTRFAFRFGDGSTGRTARAYPIVYHGAYQKALDDAGAGGFLLVRASSFGDTKKNAVVIWPGDLDNGFERDGDVLADGQKAVGGLPAAAVAAISLAVSGYPAFGADTGGYRRGKPTRESLLRWAEQCALSVVLQLGGGGSDHAPWTYDEEASAIYQRLATLHQRLFPYLSNLLSTAEQQGAPTIVPLPFAFPSDPGSRAHADDQYLLGTELLVAPVLEAGKTERIVHFPPGRWVRWDDGSAFVGPRDETVPAPLGTPPLFVREGALVPLLPTGIDTVATATAPGVTSLASRSDVEGLAIVAGNRTANYDDGARLDVIDDGTLLGLRFTAGTRAKEALVELDLRAKKGGPAVPTKVTDGSSTLPARSTLDDLSATPGPGFVFVSGRLFVRTTGGELHVE